jgi:Ca2+-dependent lipid-binding protein
MVKRTLFFSVIVTVFILSTIATEDLYAGSNYEIKIIAARIAVKKDDGRNWDLYPKSPDPFVKVFIAGDLVLQTSVQKDTYTPLWNEKEKISYEKGLSVRIEVWDRDAMSDDSIGTWEGNKLPDGELSFGQVRELSISVN